MFQYAHPSNEFIWEAGFVYISENLKTFIYQAKRSKNKEPWIQKAICYPKSPNTLHSSNIQYVILSKTFNKQKKALETQAICYPKSGKTLNSNNIQYVFLSKTFNK
jgi:hypothetical protein